MDVPDTRRKGKTMATRTYTDKDATNFKGTANFVLTLYNYWDDRYNRDDSSAECAIRREAYASVLRHITNSSTVGSWKQIIDLMP